jgi:hypothetical protein
MPQLVPVDHDPFAAQKTPAAVKAAPKLQPVDHDPFAQDEALRGELLADVPGSRITSTWRSPEHNREVGGVSDSRHLKDDAIDFLPPAGMTRAQAVAAIRARDPKPQELLDEGDHIHYSPSRIPSLTPVDHDPFAAAPPAKAPSPAPKAPSKPPVAAPAPVDPNAGNPFAKTAERAGRAGSDIVDALKHPGVTAANPFVPGVDVGRIGGDVLGVALSPIGGAAEAASHFLPDDVPSEVAKHDPKVAAFQAKQRRTAPGDAERALGDVAETLTPIPGAEGAEALRGASRLGREALAGGREAVAAGDAARLHTTTLPKPPKMTPVEGDPFQATGGPGKPRSLAAAVEVPPRTSIVGDETNPATRTANALYRLNGSNIADKIELGRARAELQKAHGDKSEALYHALEEPLVKSDAAMPTELQEAKAALDPYLKEQTEISNRLRKRADPTLDAYLEDQGYVHRIRSDQPNVLDASDQGGPRSPFQSRKSLVKTADSQKQRKFIVLEDTSSGKRTVVDTAKDKAYRELKPGMTYRPPGEGPSGAKPLTFKVAQPTTREIEAAGPTRYKKDAIDNTIANVFQLRRVERNLDVLEQTLSDMKERGVAHREEWTYPDPETGRRTVGSAKRPEEAKGFKSLPDVPQLKGWVFNHEDAQVQELKDWLPKHSEDWVDSLDRINNFMLRSNFLSPFVHPKNIAEFWGASRGWDWLHPQGYGRLARTLPEAWREVATMGPKYQRYLREGSAMLSADARTQDFHSFLTDTAGQQLIKDLKSFKALTDAMGVKIRPDKLYKSYQEWSHKMMWMVGDTMMMQRVLELQEKGTPIRDAIRKAEEMIPNYRVPAQIMDSKTGGRMLHHMFANNRFFSVGRYHYSKLAAWGRMFKKIAKGTPEEKVEAAGQFVAMAVMGAMIIPAIDEGLKIATGNQNARVKRGGVLSLPDAAGRLYKGEEGPAQAIAQVIDLSPEAELGTEMIKQKDFYGEDLASKFKSPAGNIAGEVNPALSQFGPLQGVEGLGKPGQGAERVAGNMFGLDLPPRPPGSVKASTAKMLRGKARKQEGNDPLTRGLQSLGVP